LNPSEQSFWLVDDELSEIMELIKSGNIIQGKEVKEFEKEFARYVGAKYVLQLIQVLQVYMFQCRYLTIQNSIK